MKLLIITFLLALGSNTVIAQNEVPPTPPPPMDIPDEENEPLIDKLIKVAEYELMFDLMKDEIVHEFAVENNWSKHKIKDVKSQIKYKDVPDWIFYNGYTSETKEELNRLIAYYKKRAMMSSSWSFQNTSLSFVKILKITFGKVV